jgi:hypothetical protein
MYRGSIGAGQGQRKISGRAMIDRKETEGKRKKKEVEDTQRGDKQ